MGEKKQLNVRIPLELQEKIETSGRSKVDIVIEALELYFNSKKPKETIKEETQAESPASPGSVSKLEPVESDEMNRMKKEVDFLRTKIDDLLTVSYTHLTLPTNREV